MALFSSNEYRVVVEEAALGQYDASPNPIREGAIPEEGGLVDVLSGGFGGHGHYLCPIKKVKRPLFRMPVVVVDFDNSIKIECDCH